MKNLLSFKDYKEFPSSRRFLDLNSNFLSNEKMTVVRKLLIWWFLFSSIEMWKIWITILRFVFCVNIRIIGVILLWSVIVCQQHNQYSIQTVCWDQAKYCPIGRAGDTTEQLTPHHWSTGRLWEANQGLITSIIENKTCYISISSQMSDQDHASDRTKIYVIFQQFFPFFVFRQ